MSKLRVYMVAKELGTDNKTLVALFQSLGVDDVKNHMSAVSADQVERAKRQLAKGTDRGPESRVAPPGGSGASNPSGPVASSVIRRGKKADEVAPAPVEATPPVRRAGPSGAGSAGAGPASGGAVRSVNQGPAPVTAAPVVARGAAAPSTAAAPASAPTASVVVPAVATQAVPATAAAGHTAPAAVSAPDVSTAAPAASRAVAVQGSPSDVTAAAPAREVAAAPVAARTADNSAPAAGAKASGPSHSGPVASEPSVSAPSASAASASEASKEAPASVERVAAVAPQAAPATTSQAAKPSAAAVEAQAVPERAAPAPAAEPSRAATSSESAARTEAVRADAAVEAEPASIARPVHDSVVVPAESVRGAAAAGDANGQRTPPVRGREVRPLAATPARPAEAPPRPTSPPKTGIDVWQGRPGVPMPQQPRGAIPRRVQYDAKAGGAAAGGPRRGPPMPGQVGGGGQGPRGNSNMRGGPGGPGGARRGNFGSLSSRRPGPQSVTTQERAAHKKVVRMEQDISLQTLAARMGVKAGEVLMKLMSLGVTGVNINSTLDSDTAKIVAEEFGWTVEDVAVSEDAAIAAAQGTDPEEDPSEREPRPPVVTVMGHVDHGKTSLLDKIRRATVAAGEAGGITQHIGAYSVKTPKGRITFMDTPGHAAFSQMRARGAKATDLIVLVVAADDGVMPQTKEAINHARDARCPIVVAVNKVDKPDAQPERVRRELSDVGLMPEEWGGNTLFVEVSAQTGHGIEALLDAILLQSEMLALTANPKRHARGTVIEAKLDRGRGPVATILVTEGTLRKGDGLLVGNSWGKVRAMLDDTGRSIAEAGPSTPVAVIGLSEVPNAGDMVDAVQDAKKAQGIAEQRRDKLAERARGATSKVSLEELARRMSQNDQKELKVIVKGDVQGTVEALNDALEKMSTEKVRVNVVHSGVGAITEGDVNLAVAARALIIGFNTRPAGKASLLAMKEGIEIRQYSIIYDVTDDVKACMEGLLTPTLVEEPIGEAEVRKIFKVSKAGVVAGCMVIQGVVRRNAMIRLRREKDIIWEGKLESLKRFKDDVKEVREGFDCGISFSGFSNLQEGDIISAFELKEVRPTL